MKYDLAKLMKEALSRNAKMFVKVSSDKNFKYWVMEYKSQKKEIPNPAKRLQYYIKKYNALERKEANLKKIKKN